ncbi:ABC transporter ATP-binding protein [Kurthia huakuii]|uniref:ABC transporter ATP-binding protein n=1 Tax=Kurthia huakuii TaxID=1421019 RepID=UPI0004961E10|nr:ABC transporter ATP-binding protein [Kurthia huakuii]MBM7699450.1 ABC-2 type transport system ATP-binding protein [Kurthia huakuii]
MSIIEMHHVTKTFGHVTALDGVDLAVEQGEIFGFIGPNGAGKSTTIRVLLGMLRKTSGEALLFDEDAWANAVAIHKRLAYVPGDVSLWPNLTGGEVIDVLMRMNGQHHPQRREQLIERFQLDVTKKCRTYSKGNRQKVALIAALAMDVELYIFDEPTAGLDPLMERVFQEYVRDMKREGKTVLLSSHILSEVESLCDRVALIHNGKIVEMGTLEDLRHLTRVTMRVETVESPSELDQLAGVFAVEQQGNVWHFDVEKDALPQVMGYLAPLRITQMETEPPSLEELFVRHYEGGV